MLHVTTRIIGQGQTTCHTVTMPERVLSPDNGMSSRVHEEHQVTISHGNQVLKGNRDANKRPEVINGGTSPYIMGAAEFNWGQAKYILST